MTEPEEQIFALALTCPKYNDLHFHRALKKVVKLSQQKTTE